VVPPGYHGLVREGFDQIDLSVGEWMHLGAPDTNHTDGHARSDERDGQYGAVAELSCPLTLRSNIKLTWLGRPMSRFSRITSSNARLQVGPAPG
jgi:hypothetical protein